MRERRVIGIPLLFSALVLLTTCQMQFNKSNGNSLDLRIVVPAVSSSGGKSSPTLGTNGKDLAGGASLAVTVTPPQGAAQTLSASIGGKTSVDFSFTLSSSGSYQVMAQMMDGSGDLLSTMSTQLSVPTGNYPVVIALPSNLLNPSLFDDINEENPGGTLVSFGFSPTVYSYRINNAFPTYSLAPTTVDPIATITMTENGSPVLPSDGVYLINDFSETVTVIIVVTTAGGPPPVTYTIVLNHIS